MRDATHRARSATETSCRYSANRPPALSSRTSALGHVHPRVVPIAEDGFRRAGLGVGDENGRRILFPIELADSQAAAVLHPVHPKDVMVARIARDLHPSWSAAIHAGHAY